MHIPFDITIFNSIQPLVSLNDSFLASPCVVDVYKNGSIVVVIMEKNDSFF